MRMGHGQEGLRRRLSVAAFVAGALSIVFAATLFVVARLVRSGRMTPDASQSFLWVPIVALLVSVVGISCGAQVLATKQPTGRGLAAAGIVLSLLGLLGLALVFFGM